MNRRSSYPNSRCGMSLGSRAWLAILVMCLCGFPGSMAAQQVNEERVLLVFGEYKQRAQFLEAFESSVRAQVKADITFDEAYMEGPGPEGPDFKDPKPYLEGVAGTLHRRFLGLKHDLVVAFGPWATSFVVQYRDKMFPGVPVVFTAVSDWEFEGRKWQGVTGVTNHVGLGETIDLALRLEPHTETVALISPYDPPWLAATHKELSRYPKVKEIDFIGSPGRQLFEKVIALPPHTVVLFHLALQEFGQPPLAGFDLLDAIAERFPTFSAWENFCMNHGCIGGVYQENTDTIELTASEAARVLSGEPIDKIPVGHVTGFQPHVDWRALQRWHIPESALPPGTQVLFREPTLWEQGRKYFLAAFAVIVLQSLLIFALFWQRARRRKAEIELGRSEQKFSKAFQRSPLAITIVSASDGRYIDVNEAFEMQTGWKRDEVIGRSPEDLNLWVNPEQRIASMKPLVDQGNAKDLEVTFRRKDGQVRTGLGSAELIDVHGEPCALSVIADITERKQAEDAMAGFSRRLIEAQETERSRIARELHDDINQRLAMVAISLKMAKESLPNSGVRTSLILDETGEKVSELETDVQALSHRLHSSKLEYLGLEAAISGFCRELSERQNIKIDLHCEGIPEDLSSDVSLCLFRVLQEALHNAAKYSGVTEFDVALTGASHEIQMRVHDSGVGFDASRASNGHGLGLTSMKERLRLVSGELSIESELGNGTTVFARVPVGHDTTAAGAGTAA
jgi:PAS domain S-box-containing protein